MKCQICEVEFESKRKESKFCSITCKAQSQKGKRPNLNEGKIYVSKIDNKTFDGNALSSGALFKYSKKVLKKDFDISDWDLIDVQDNTPYWFCPECDFKVVCNNGKDNSGWIRRHLQDNHKYLSIIDICNKYPDFKSLWPHSLNKQIKESNKMDSEANRIQCLECNNWFYKISNTHLRNKHNMTPDQYKLKHNLDVISCEYTLSKQKKNYFLNENLIKNNYTSKGQADLKKFIESFGYETKTRRDDQVELDIFIPELGLAIEFNGLYWHSEVHGKKSKFYHLSKTEYCESKGIHLIHIFEDEWRDKREIVMSRIRNIIGKNEVKLYAKNCIVKEIDPSVKNLFLQENHIQGKDKSVFKIGLYHKNELVSVMTFRKPLISMGYNSNNSSYELSRFCNKKFTSVVGAATKLLKYAEEKYNFSELISYADRRWSSNSGKTVYDNMGFIKDGCTGVNYWYLQRHYHRLYRYDYAKYKIVNKFPDANSLLSEWDNMKNLGYDRIWDCGSIRYIKKY